MKVFGNLMLCLSLAALAACTQDPISTDPETGAMQKSRGGGDKSAPTKPTNFRSTGNTSWSVSLAWTASTDASGIASYRIRDNWNREIAVPGTQTSVTWKYPAHPPLQAGATYTFTMYAVDGAGNKSASTSGVTVALPNDNTAPTVPTFTVTSLGTRHIGLKWSSIDESHFMSYKVTKDGVPLSSGWLCDSTRTFTLLQPGTTYTFTAQARDQFCSFSDGRTSAVSPGFSVTTQVNDGSDVTAPTQPSPIFAEMNGGGTELAVYWTASTDNVTPQNVILYEIFVNGRHENSAIGTTQTHAYGDLGNNTVTVVAIDEAGNRSVAGTTTVFIQ